MNINTDNLSLLEAVFILREQGNLRFKGIGNGKVKIVEESMGKGKR